MPYNPKSLKNLEPGSPGRKPRWGEPANKIHKVKITDLAKRLLKAESNPFSQAGYSGVSEFVEMALRGLVKVPEKPND